MNRSAGKKYVRATDTDAESLTARAYEQLEKLIITGALEPGRIYTETELGQLLVIGRTPLREALLRLSAQRLVQSIPRRGVLISQINVADHFALLETRRVMDRLLAAKAARRATPDQRAAFRRLADEMTRAATENDLDLYLRIDRDFDELLERAARNPFAALLSTVLHSHNRRFWFHYHQDDHFQDLAQLHIAVMRKVADGDESAAADAAERIIDQMEQFTRKVLDIP